MIFLHGHFEAVEESHQSCSQIAENQICKLNTTFEAARHLQIVDIHLIQ